MALKPWATTERMTVQATTGPSGPVSTSADSRTSSASSTKTTEASPRGPNQPMKPTLTRSKPVPTSESATGTMRTAVSESTA